MPEFAPAAAFIFYWALIGIDICPPWPWPWPWPGPRPGPWPPPPPPWFSVIGILAAIAAGWFFTATLGGVGPSRFSPIVEFAATGVFAAVGAFAVRALIAPLVTPKGVQGAEQLGGPR